MSDQSTPDPAAPDPVAAALAVHTARLGPGSAEQLTVLFSDLKGLPPGVVADLTRLRLNDPIYAKFLKPPDPDPAAGRADDTAAAKPGISQQLKTSVDARRAPTRGL